MFRFKSGTFQFVLLFIYIQNKQKTHERKRTVDGNIPLSPLYWD